MNEIRKPRSLFFPALLVIAGVFLLLANLGLMQGTAWGIMVTYWPLIFIVGGLDGLYRRDGWAGPLVAIGLGTILLLGSLHYLQWGGFSLLLRLWPILLIAWGVDVAFSHSRSLWSTLARVAIGMLLVAGIVWLAISSPFGSGIKSQTFSQTLDKATHSALTFSDGAGELTLAGGNDTTKLVSGSAGVPEDIVLTPGYAKPVDGVSSFRLEGSGVVVLPVGNPAAPWDFKFNSSVPIDLTTRMGAGNMMIDLAGTKTETIRSEMGVGQTVITFPKGQNVTGKIENAVGETTLRFPKGTSVVIHYSGGLTSVQLSNGFSRSDGKITSDFTGDYQVELDVNQAIGSLSVTAY